MGMWSTENQDSLTMVLKKSSKSAHQRFHQSHAYEACYLQSVLIYYIKHLPKRVQKQLISDMVKATQRQEQVLIERMQETL